MLDTVFLKTIDTIPWFAHCGESVFTDVPIPIQSVASWREALAACLQPTWEDVTLEARNTLTVFLHQHARFAYRDWNTITVAAKQYCVTPLTDHIWMPFCKAHGFDVGFVQCVQWDILGAIMEHEYRHYTERPTFFLHVLSLYKAGHFPCGWSGGPFPQGRLLLF